MSRRKRTPRTAPGLTIGRRPGQATHIIAPDGRRIVVTIKPDDRLHIHAPADYRILRAELEDATLEDRDAA